MQNKPQVHRLFHKHRIVVCKLDGQIAIGKVVDSVIEKVGVTTTVKVGEICTFKENKRSKKLVYVNTFDIGDRQPVALKRMRLPNDAERKLYNKYRK